MASSAFRPLQLSRWGTTAFLLALLSCLVLVLAGCNKDDDDIASPSGGGGGGSLRTHVVGMVKDVSGAPISGVTITSGGQSTMSDAAGAFMLRNVDTDARCYVRAQRSGYFPGSAGVIARANGTTRVRITLLTDAPVATFSGGSGTETTLSGGAKVVIGGSTVVDGGGNNISGNVTLSVRHLDPDAPEFAAIMPGGDLVATGSDGDRQLQSFGMMMVRMTDGGGNELQIAEGSTAQLTMPVPPSLLGEAPPTMPLWHYNENSGKWEEDGVATLEGGQYVGSVGHFSSWNCDLPFDRATVTGLVVDCNGEPVEGVTVDIGQAQAVTDAQGRYERFVPTGLPMTVRVDAPELGLSSSVLSTGPFTDGQSTTMGTLEVDCPAYVSFQLVCTSGAQVFGYTSLNWGNGSTVIPFSGPGTYRIAVPANGGTAQMNVVHGNGAPGNTTVQLPSIIGETQAAGSFEICPAGSGSGQYTSTFTINGDGHNNQQVTITTTGLFSTAVYSVPDDGTVAYATGVGGNVIQVIFPGSSTSTWTVVDGDSEAMTTVTLGGNTYFMQNGTLVVTEYGPVGGNVRGTFSGEYARFDQATMQMIPATVTNGTFNLLRGADEE